MTLESVGIFTQCALYFDLVGLKVLYVNLQIPEKYFEVTQHLSIDLFLKHQYLSNDWTSESYGFYPLLLCNLFHPCYYLFVYSFHLGGVFSVFGIWNNHWKIPYKTTTEDRGIIICISKQVFILDVSFDSWKMFPNFQSVNFGESSTIIWGLWNINHTSSQCL